jgi:phosphoglycerate dehydrogenase-like enzyme
MTMRKVLIAPPGLAEFNGEYRRVLREAGFELVFADRASGWTESRLIEGLSDKEAVLAGSEVYSRRVIESCSKLTVIARQGVGHDAVDLEAATTAGIVVTNTPGSNHEAVAEHAFGLILALAKNFFGQDREMRLGGWPRRPTLPVRSRTLGIVGLGRIGKAVATRGAAFGMTIMAADIAPDREFIASHGIELAIYERVVREADYLTFHVPLTSLTRHMLDGQALAEMKAGAFVVNTSRGGVIDEQALLEALKRHRIAGAALDVYENEPARSHDLFGLNNVILTAHSAGIDQRSRADMALFAAQAIASLAKGEWPEGKVINPDVRGRLRRFT